MRKLIDIDDDILVPLKVEAAKKNKDLKTFIQDVLRNLINKTKTEKIK